MIGLSLTPHFVPRWEALLSAKGPTVQTVGQPVFKPDLRHVGTNRSRLFAQSHRD